MKALKNSLSKPLWWESVNSLISTITTYDLPINDKSSHATFLNGLELWKPNKKDLEDKGHCHYNPNSLINVFMTNRMYKAYGIEALKLPNVKMEKLARDDFKVWLAIEDTKDLKKLVSHLNKKGYTFIERSHKAKA